MARNIRYAKYNARDVYDTYMAAQTPVVPTPLGFNFGGLASRAHAAMQEGTFELAEVRLLSSLMPHVDLFVDIGANVGYFTCLARTLGKPAVAVEPMPKNLAALYRNLRANNWTDTEVLPLAASGRVGLETLYGASGTGASLIDQWAGAPSAFKRTICVSTMDNLFAGRFVGARFLVKIDVEGNEYQTLLGAQQLLRRSPPPVWLVEITSHEYHPDGNNPTFAQSFGLFFDCGYRAFLVKSDALSEVTDSDVRRWTVAGKTDCSDINYLFVPPDMLHLVGRVGKRVPT